MENLYNNFETEITLKLPETDSNVLIKIILNACASGDIPTLNKSLDRISLNSLDLNTLYKFLYRMIATSAEFGQGKICEFLIDYWEDSNPNNGDIHELTFLFLSNIFDEKILKYIVKNYQFTSFVHIINDLINYGESEKCYEACRKAIYCFNVTSINVVNEVLRYARYRGSISVRICLENLLEKINVYAPIPEHVKNFFIDPNLPIEEEMEDFTIDNIALLEKFSDEEYVKYITSERISDVDKSEAITKNQVTLMHSLDKKKIKDEKIYPIYMKFLENNIELFRWFGPAHMKYNSDFSEETICGENGGCRMLTCNCFSSKDEDENEYEKDYENLYEDWFRGACDFCHRRILNRSHSVRKPLEYGGWIGCYCSWKCIKEHIIGFYENGYATGIKILKPELKILRMIIILEELTLKIGIQNRRSINNIIKE